MTQRRKRAENVSSNYHLTGAEQRLFYSDDFTYDVDNHCHDSSGDDYNNGSEDDHDQDSLVCLDDTLDDEGFGEVCELHVYENRYNSRGIMVTMQVGAMDRLNIELDRNPYAALVVVRTYNEAKVLKHTKLEIRSPYMKKALREVIGSYPGVSFDCTGMLEIEIADGPRCIFHYRHELREYAETSEDDDIKEHVDFLLRYMTRAIHKEIISWQTLMESNEREPGLEWADLWMAYRPGELLYHYDLRCEDSHILRLRTMLLPCTNRGASSNETPGHWGILVEELYCNGIYVAFCQQSLQIPRYDGYRALSSLPIFPLRYHPREAQIREEVLNRGKHWLSLAGFRYRSYTGVAQILKNTDSGAPAALSSSIAYNTLPAHGRIVIDPEEFNLNVTSGVRFLPGSKKVEVGKITNHTFTPDEICLCTCYVSGFSLALKRWGYFHVQNIKPVVFNNTAFDDMIIAQNHKDLIRSLVNDNESKQPTFDDLIQGKGKGLIFLLHGPPGVGKTLTAEALADFTQRPLYTVGCGDLGINITHVERTLTRALELARRWNALVLIDEADVFMSQRTNDDLHHNELVSVLLRVLEYFEGVMILTTNRVGAIDPAFKSRIHLSLNYPPLSFETRSGIWQALIAKGTSTPTPTWLGPELLKQLARYDINGRQIKNIIRMACAIAANEQRGLEPGDILKGLEALATFDEHFGRPGVMKGVQDSAISWSVLQHLHNPGWLGIALTLSISYLVARRYK